MFKEYIYIEISIIIYNIFNLYIIKSFLNNNLILYI